MVDCRAPHQSDSDKDGQPDVSGFLAGTDPYDPGSELSIDGITPVVNGNSIALDIEFPVVQGRLYRVEYSRDLSNWSVILGPETPVGGINRMKLRAPLPGGLEGFVRVSVSLE